MEFNGIFLPILSSNPFDQLDLLLLVSVRN